MENINISDFDFNGTTAYSLNELAYAGKLYHYTDQGGCAGIFNPCDSQGNKIKIPSDCISLRFTRIENMTKNDLKERKHIETTVQEVINSLEKEPDNSEKHITAEFADIVRKFQSNYTDYYFTSSDLCDEARTPALKLEHGELDYYVACFSTCADNVYLMEMKKGSPIRLAFYEFFSEKISYLKVAPYFNLRLEQSGLPYFIRRVEYDDSKKRNLIEKFLLDIYHHHIDEEDIESQLQIMYSLYDAFFKEYANSENEYWKEKEVRFVIRLSSDKSPDYLKRYGIILDHEIEDRGKIKYKYLYLPVNKEFLIGGVSHA